MSWLDDLLENAFRPEGKTLENKNMSMYEERPEDRFWPSPTPKDPNAPVRPPFGRPIPPSQQPGADGFEPVIPNYPPEANPSVPINPYKSQPSQRPGAVLDTEPWKDMEIDQAAEDYFKSGASKGKFNRSAFNALQRNRMIEKANAGNQDARMTLSLEREKMKGMIQWFKTMVKNPSAFQNIPAPNNPAVRRQSEEPSKPTPVFPSPSPSSKYPEDSEGPRLPGSKSRPSIFPYFPYYPGIS